MTLADFVKRVDSLLGEGEVMLSRANSDGFGRFQLPPSLFAQYRSAGLSFIKNVYAVDHPYYSEFDSNCKDGYVPHGAAGQGILRAIRAELEGGWIRTTTGLITASVFADFLEMAAHLLEEQYKDAAAVIAGSTLEEHLRQLATVHGIAIEQLQQGKMVPRKADRLNSDLADAEVYEKLDQKNVTAWLDLRNNAAHGQYGQYQDEQVRLMIDGVRDFLTRIPV